MQVQLQRNRLVLIPDSESERTDLQNWKAARSDFVFVVVDDQGKGACLSSLGPRAEACREPINVHSKSPDPQIALIANFAPTPFTLDDERYACVEAFWQSLRFPPEERARIAELDGQSAKRASAELPYGSHVTYAGKPIPVGTFAHWQLMQRACFAKFQQNDAARDALLATGTRPLVHRVKPDSKTIPGVVMADIWMRLRARFRRIGSTA
jgi:predicted NAD-dependent protein-ADP-ribosyltransferase YbiA (DUF1768 family)